MEIEDQLNNADWLSENCTMHKSLTVECWIKKDSDIGYSMMEGRKLRIDFEKKSPEVFINKTDEQLPKRNSPDSTLKATAKNSDIAYLEAVGLKDNKGDEMIKSYTIRFLKFKDPSKEEIMKIIESENFIFNPKSGNGGCFSLLVFLLSLAHLIR